MIRRICVALVFVAASPLAAFAGDAPDIRMMKAADGSELVLQRQDGKLLKLVTAAGAVAKTTYTFTHAQFGTVAEGEGSVSGVFLMNGASITTAYDDGRAELLVGDAQQGVSVVRKTADGEVSCATWYPAGHRFTAAERKAALAQYARRIGLADPRLIASGGKDPCVAAIKLARATDARTDAPAETVRPAAPRRSDTLSQIMNQVLAAYVPAPATSGDFDKFYAAFLAGHEGGYTANDGNGAPANFGINQGANPDIDVAALTQDRARQLLYERYWLTSGADRLGPALAAVHGDSAVNFGVRAANDLLAQSGGDPARYLDLREMKYLAIAASSQEKAQYLPVWLARNDDLRRYIGGAEPAGDSALPAFGQLAN